MELPREILDARESNRVADAERNRWVYALSCSRMYRKALMRSEGLRLWVDEQACELARSMSSRELIGRAGLAAALNQRIMACVYVRAYLKQERGYVS